MYVAHRQYFALLQALTIVCVCITLCQGSAIKRAVEKPKTCAKFDEYCINHWDCCSNRCMSFTYRCIRNSNFYPYPVMANELPAQSTLDGILASNFGSVVATTTNEKTPEPESLDIKIRFDDVAGVADRTSTSSNMPVINDANNALSSTAQIQIDNVQVAEQPQQQQQQQHQQQEQQSLNEVASTTAINTSQNTRSIATSDCKEIGEKCYRNEECCTTRCHGFLHQCVT